MAWKDISASTYKKFFNSNSQATWEANNNVYITLQYDDASVKPTSVKLRFKLNRVDSQNYWDMFYILLYPTDASKRKLFKLKTEWTGQPSYPSPHYPYTSTETFTITKSYNAQHFGIPAYWICNDGWNNTTDDTAFGFYEMYKDSTYRGKNCKTAVGGTTISIASSSTVATAVSGGSVSITDNLNNSYTVKGTGGTNGTNNAVKSAILTYTLANGTNDNLDCKGKTVTRTVAFTPNDTANTRTITASVNTNGTYNNPAAVTTSANIKQYVAPNAPGKPTLTAGSFSAGGRLTLKNNWTYTWEKATRKNYNSTVRGYRIRLLVNDKQVHIKDVNGKIISQVSSSGVIYYDTESTDTSFTIYPNQQDIKVGDTVVLGIFAYTRDGKNNQYFNSSRQDSKKMTVQNAGVVHVKVEGKWRVGRVFVKVENKWREAENVKAKVENKWRESI